MCDACIFADLELAFARTLCQTLFQSATHGINGFVIPTNLFVKIGTMKIFCYNNKMFSSINKTFGFCRKNFGCSNKKIICCP